MKSRSALKSPNGICLSILAIIVKKDVEVFMNKIAL